MKTVKNLCQCIVVASLALAGAGLLSAPASARAQQKEAEKLMPSKPLTTVAAVQPAKAGDRIAMCCPSCKDTSATVVEKSFKGANQDEVKTVKTHLCSACETKRISQGHGKMASEVVVHTCTACGSKDLSCCATQKGSGPTPGMEDKK
jgi:hypothetical protein